MAVNSKNKGNTFERKISNLLSDRFKDYTGLEAGFRRNVDSGSFFGASNQKRIQTHDTEHACFGDIMTPSAFRYTIECKHYKTAPTFAAIIKQEWKLFDDWIGQAQQDANNSNKEMLVIVKFNNVSEFAILEGYNKDAAISYKGKSFVPLDIWLAQADEFFFKTEEA